MANQLLRTKVTKFDFMSKVWRRNQARPCFCTVPAKYVRNLVHISRDTKIIFR